MKKPTALLLLLPALASADLGPELQYLANTPVSRLEFALQNWQSQIDEWIEFEQQNPESEWARKMMGNVTLGLDPTENVIRFHGVFVGSPSDSKITCAEFLDATRDRFTTRGHSDPLKWIFGHRPYEPPAPAEDMGRAIGKLVEVSCYFRGYETRSFLIPGDDE